MAKTKKRGAPSNIALDASKQKQFNQKVKKVNNKVKNYESEPGVVYISHLPWGFEEKPLREYFKQFGAIKQLRLSRSKKTGNSRGYAYIQFNHDDVAKIVADTMNNYLMFGKLIKCKHLQNPHPGTFKNAQRRFFKPKGIDDHISKHNSEKSDEAVEKSQKKMMGKLAKLQAKLASQGIKYKFEDPYLEKVKEGLKEKAEARKLAKEEEGEKAEKKKKLAKKVKKAKNDDDEDNDDSDDDDDSDEVDSDDDEDDVGDDSDEEGDIEDVDDEDDSSDVVDDSDDDEEDDEDDDTEVLKTPAKQQKVQKTVKNVKSNLKPKVVSENKSGKNTGKRQSLIPKEVDTPKGKINVLIEDSSEDEVSFKTPPNSIKSSKLPDSIKSMKGTPKTAEKRSPKRKLSETESKRTATPATVGKKIKLTPGIAQKKGTPRSTEKKSQEKKLNKEEIEPKRTATPGNTGKTVKLTPGNNQKKDNVKVGSAKKNVGSAKKNVGSAKKSVGSAKKKL